MSPWRGDPVGDRWKPIPFREEVAELAAVAPLSWRVVLVERWGALWPPDPDHKLTGKLPPQLHVTMRSAEYGGGRTYPPATAADLAELERDRGPLAVLELVGRLWRYMAQGGAPAEGNEPQAFNPPPLYLWTLAAGTVDKEGGTTGRPAVELMDRLARRLWGRLAELVARLPLTAEALEARGLAEDDGLLWLDRAMVAEVRRVYGVELDTDAARERWSAWERGELDGGACALLRRWLDPEAEGPVPAAWPADLARLELELLRAELERERRPVALPVGVLELMAAPLRATGGLQAGSDGREWLTRARANAPAELLAPWQPPTVAAQDAGRLLELARAGVAGLVTVNGPRLVYWLAREVQLRGVDDARPLVFDGGDCGNAWAALAREVGAPTDRQGARAMREIVAALGSTLLILETKKGRQEGNLLAYHYQEGRGRGHLSRLELRPGWPFQLNPAELRGEGGELSALAPLPPLLGNLPPMPGTLRRNDHAAGGRLWLAVLAELATSNREIAKGNGAPLPGSRLAGLAVAVGVTRPEPLVLGAGLLELWTRDGDHGPALLERVGPDRYHLGAAFPEERRLLEEGGQRREGQAERGAIATRKRSANADKAAARRAKRKGGT